MPSTYSPNLRIELIASGEQGNTWGGTTNNNLGTLIENAISGTVSIDSMPSNTYTLTVLNGANDNARNMYIKVSSSTTLTAAGTIIAPAVSKMYVITNSSLGGFAVTLKTSASTGISIPNGATRTVFYNGADFVDTVTATQSLLLDANATQNLQATTKQQMDAGLALKLSLAGGTGNTMAGPLYLQNTSDPGADQCAIPRGYATTTFLPKTNPTVTGTLTLSSTDPVGYQATSKNYNDSFYVAKTGSTMTGALTLYSTLPTTAWQAVPKQYVDNITVNYGPGISITGTIAANNVAVNLLYATTSTIGGVKVDGTSITINGSGVISAATGGGGTVTGVSVATSNGFYGSSSGGATPSLTLATTVNGILKSAGSVSSPAAISAASGADIAAAIGSATVTNATNASSANSAPWSGVTGKPTTVAGYGITDAITTGNIGRQSVNYASSAGDSSALNGISGAGYLRTDCSNSLLATSNYSCLIVGNTGTSQQMGMGPVWGGGSTYFPGLFSVDAYNSAFPPLYIAQRNALNAYQTVLTFASSGVAQFNYRLDCSAGLNVYAGTKNFFIQHPILPNKDLVHCAVEAPRADLVYRGTVTLIAGQATVDIDAASRMTSGTFDVLTQNVEIMALHNKDGFTRVKASAVTNGLFTIIAEDPTCTDEISWLVMAERNDTVIKSASYCDTDGRLVPEQDKAE